MVQWSQSTAVVTHSCPVGYFCQLIIIVFFVFWGTCPLFYLLVHRIETEMPPHKHQIQKHFPFFFPVLAPFLTWRCTPANPDAHLCSSSSQLRVALFWVPSHLAEKRKKKKKRAQSLYDAFGPNGAPFSDRKHLTKQSIYPPATEYLSHNGLSDAF